MPSCVCSEFHELLGALGMFLPLLTGILPWLTALAAVGFAIIQILAILPFITKERIQRSANERGCRHWRFPSLGGDGNGLQA